MFGRLGAAMFGASEFIRRILGGSKLIACLGDPASHPGLIIVSGQTGVKLYVSGVEAAVNGALFYCEIHGIQNISPVITKTFCGGKLIITDGAIVGCGAIVHPPNRKAYAG